MIRKEETTRILLGARDARAAVDELIAPLYGELRALAGRQLGRGRGNLLQPTELVHEAYLRLIDQRQVDADHRTIFFAAAVVAMRRVLIDRAREQRALKRGGDCERVELKETLLLARRDEPDLLDLQAALEVLAGIDEIQGRVAELKLFANLTHTEVCEILAREGYSTTVEKVGRLWRTSRAWLAERLEGIRS